MGVYIKGLKLPSAERQGELLILTDDGRCVDMFSGEYEAVELQPHGDLIDKMALLNHMINVHKEWQEHPEQHKSIITIVDDEIMVDFFPSIIGAEDGT